MFNFAEQLPPARPRYVLKLVAVSAVIVLCAISGYILLNPEPPVPEGELIGVKLYAPSVAASLAAFNAAPAGAQRPAPAPALVQPDSKLLVLTPVKLHNTSNQPLSIFNLSAVVEMGNAQYESVSVSEEDFPKVFHYYPDLAAFEQPPLLRHTVLQPGETRSGLLVFNYPLTEEQWDRRSSFQVKVAFDHGKDAILSEAQEPVQTAQAQ